MSFTMKGLGRSTEKTASVLAPGFAIAMSSIVPLGLLGLGNPCVGHGLAWDLRPQGQLELGQMAVAFDPPQARLDEAQRTGHPALFLVRRAPGSRKRGQATFQESRVDSNGLKLFFDRS